MSSIFFQEVAMRVSRQEAEANRERILDEASRRIRESGLDGVGVAGIMKGAGLTHGGFYGHFESKEDLAAQAYRRAQDAAVDEWQRFAATKGPHALAAIARSYLSPRHRDQPGGGCPVSALAAEVARGDSAVRDEMTAGIARAIAALEQAVPGRAGEARRRKAL